MIARPLIIFAIASATAVASPSAAQRATSTATPAQQATAYTRAVAAGYKALMTCGAIFNARQTGATRTQVSVDAWEMKGIYSEYESLAAAMPATIGADRVTVAFDDKLPPRLAVSRGPEGCVIYPVGTDPALTNRPFQPPLRATPRPWPLGNPAAVVAPDARLSPIFARALSGGYGGRTTAVLVVQGGKLAGEAYAPDFGPAVPQRTWSVAKSMAGTVIGAAAHASGFDVMKPARLPEWRTPGDPRGAITTDQLLRMASGLHSDTPGNRTDAIYFGGIAVTEETVAWGLDAQPGTRFRYANNDILLAIRALRASGRVRDYGFARDLLFAPLGMADTIAEHDWQFNYVLSSQVWSTARDFARLGQLWLDDGMWQGRRILPKGWMAYMTRPSGPQPAAGPGYGATLWLFGPKQGLPEGTYAAQGNRGQYIFVVPSRKLVVVRRGEDLGGGGFNAERFVADVIAALG